LGYEALGGGRTAAAKLELAAAMAVLSVRVRESERRTVSGRGE